jgi:hypothetical protein
LVLRWCKWTPKDLECLGGFSNICQWIIEINDLIKEDNERQEKEERRMKRELNKGRH